MDLDWKDGRLVAARVSAPDVPAKAVFHYGAKSLPVSLQRGETKLLRFD